MGKVSAVNNKAISSKERKSLENICLKYGYLIEDISRFGKSYIITTPYSQKICIKKFKNGRRKIVLGDKITNDLFNMEFYNIARYLKTSHGNLFIKHNKGIYCATEWCECEECDFEDFNEVIKCVRLLAEFHVAASKLDVNSYRIDNKSKDYSKLYKGYLRDFQKFQRIIKSKKLKNQFDITYNEYIENFLNRAYISLNILNTSSYFKLLKAVNSSKTICIGNFNHKNIVSKNDDYFILNPNDIGVGLQITDLSKFINKLMFRKSYKWNFEKTKILIETYSSIRVLSKEELEVLLALIIFPYKFWNLGKKRYVKLKKWTETKYMHKLNKIIYYDKQQKSFIEEYFQYLNSNNNNNNLME